MAKRPAITEPNFAIELSWQAQVASGLDRALDATVGRLRINVADQIATRFESDRGDSGDSVELPVYYLANWVATNWWALLYEPKKFEDPKKTEDYDRDAERDYLTRHWIGTARNGFALPDLSIVPAGDRIEIVGRPAYLRFSRITFLEEIFSSFETAEVRNALSKFVDQVITRLNESGVKDTTLHTAWSSVCQTTAEAEEFCKLIGALGLSPYDENPEIEAILDQLSKNLPRTMLHDLCQASDAARFSKMAGLAQAAFEAAAKSQEVSLEALSEIDFPADSSPAAFRWGLEAVKRVREHFGIGARDPMGGDAFFEYLKIDPVAQPAINDGNNYSVSAAVERQDAQMKMALLEQAEAQRRFAAARAAFLGWASNSRTSRFVTAARTRDQQASRAFAAELLAPIAYIRSKAQNRLLSNFGIEKTARELGVSAAVVAYQARNNRLQLVN